MQTTPETRAIVMAPYLGQKVTHVVKGEMTLHGILLNDHKEWGGWLTGLTHTGEISIGLNYDLNDFKLQLTPLRDISDEDAIEVAKIFELHETILWKACAPRLDSKNILGEKMKYSGYEHLKVLAAYQFLQSRSYDLPHHLLNGQTLQEAGIATYKG
jgi:hypothetical protein